MKVRAIILQSVVGLLIGAGTGAVVGFLTFALGETLHPSSGFIILAPSGPLGVGIMGAVLMGMMGVVIGLITGLFSLRAIPAAGVGILIFAIQKGRSVVSEMQSLAGMGDYPQRGHFERMLVFTNMAELMLLFDYVIVGVLVAVSLRHLFAGQGRYL